MRAWGVCAVSWLCGCGGGADNAPFVAPDVPVYDATVPTVIANPMVGAGSDGETVEAGLDTVPLPPSMPCADAGLACPPPPPSCASPWVAIAYSGRCVSGACAWETQTVDCAGANALCVGAAGYDAGLDVPATDGSASVNVSGCAVTAPPASGPPATACDGDASLDSGVCPLPASVCADTKWLIYYDDGQCVAGACVWQQRERYCPGVCASGGCVPLATTVPPPPPSYVGTQQ